MDNRLLHEKIRNVLDAKGITAKDMLNSLDINNSFMTDLKKGRKPSLETIIEISTFLDVPITTLLEGNIPERLAIPQDSKLYEVYSKLDERGQLVVMGAAYSELSRIERSSFAVEVNDNPPPVTRRQGRPSVPPDKNRPKQVAQEKSASPTAAQQKKKAQ